MHYLLTLTSHDEGPLVRSSIASAREAIQALADSDVTLLVVLDSATRVTADIVSDCGVEVLETNFGDVGRVRNQVIETYGSDVSGLIFVDGDDSCCPHWLANAIRLCESLTKPTIISPSRRVHRWVLGKWQIDLPFHQPSQSGKLWGLYRAASSYTNLWGSAMFLKCPVPDALRFKAEDEGALFEDWLFHQDSLELGVGRHTAQGSHFYLQRKGSRRRLQARKRTSSLNSDGSGRFYSARVLMKKAVGFLTLVSLLRPRVTGSRCHCGL